ncbi:MAG: hypothetical protein J7493_00145 [Porphyrobacter sp.]|nr:hypothetical protein [Porphyrobacter sp.]
MHFIFQFEPTRETLQADVQRFVDFLDAHGVEAVSSLTITCFPWRNGKRLQAVNEDGEIRSVMFDLVPEDARYKPPQYELEHEPLIIRERPDSLGDFGLAMLSGHDD